MKKRRSVFYALFSIGLMISGIGLVVPINGQTLSHPDIAVLVEYWRQGQTDSVRVTLPLYERKYGSLPEVLFLRTTMNDDGNAAIAVYEELEKKHPDQALADHCLWRIIQYHVSLGRYQTASGYLNRLQSRFPRSPVLPLAMILFPESGTAPTDSLTSSSVKNRKWTLQLGAFADKANAEKWMKNLQAKGIKDLSIGEKLSAGKKLYVVLYGNFTSKEEAMEAGQIINRRYQIDYSLIQK